MRSLLELALPVWCPVCRRAGGAPCSRCEPGLPPPPPLPPPPGLRVCLAATAYEGAGRALVTALKFRGAATVAVWAAAVLAEALANAAVPDVVTWVPTAPGHRRRRRGVDGGALLAGALGEALEVPVVPLLLRPGGPAQAGRDRRSRLAGPGLEIRGPPGRQVPAVVVVADDVVTTGGSLAAAARALRGAGAATVLGAAVARTPG